MLGKKFKVVFVNDGSLIKVKPDKNLTFTYGNGRYVLDDDNTKRIHFFVKGRTNEIHYNLAKGKWVASEHFKAVYDTKVIQDFMTFEKSFGENFMDYIQIGSLIILVYVVYLLMQIAQRLGI